jgi:ribosomal silencing factor RsfS
VLIDYSDVIVHAFSPTARAYYDLEGFWSEAAVLLKMQ